MKRGGVTYRKSHEYDKGGELSRPAPKTGGQGESFREARSKKTFGA